MERVDAEYDPTADRTAPVDGCWQVENVAATDSDQFVTLDACESIGETYTVYAAGENDGCLPAGTDEFSSSAWGSTFAIDR